MNILASLKSLLFATPGLAGAGAMPAAAADGAPDFAALLDGVESDDESAPPALPVVPSTDAAPGAEDGETPALPERADTAAFLTHVARRAAGPVRVSAPAEPLASIIEPDLAAPVPEAQSPASVPDEPKPATGEGPQRPEAMPPETVEATARSVRPRPLPEGHVPFPSAQAEAAVEDGVPETGEAAAPAPLESPLPQAPADVAALAFPPAEMPLAQASSPLPISPRPATEPRPGMGAPASLSQASTAQAGMDGDAREVAKDDSEDDTGKPSSLESLQAPAPVVTLPDPMPSAAPVQALPVAPVPMPNGTQTEMSLAVPTTAASAPVRPASPSVTADKPGVAQEAMLSQDSNSMPSETSSPKAPTSVPMFPAGAFVAPPVGPADADRIAPATAPSVDPPLLAETPVPVGRPAAQQARDPIPVVPPAGSSASPAPVAPIEGQGMMPPAMPAARDPAIASAQVGQGEMPAVPDAQPDPAVPVANHAPVRAEALSLLQLVHDHMGRRTVTRDVNESAMPAVVHKDVASLPPDVATTVPHAADTVPLPPILLQAPASAASVLPTVDLSASLGARMVDMGVSDQWIDGLARDIAGLCANGAQGRFRIDADQFGPIQVDIRQGSDGAAVRLTVANDMAEAALRQDSDRLRGDAALSGVRIAEVKVERASHVAEPARAEAGGQSTGQQSSSQGQSSAWQAPGQSMGQSPSQGRWQGRENSGSGHKAGGDPAVLNHADAGDAVGEARRARYA